MKKIEKIVELDTAELENNAKQMQETMFKLRFQLGMGQTDVVKKLRETRRDRARVLTTLSQRKKAGK